MEKCGQICGKQCGLICGKRADRFAEKKCGQICGNSADRFAGNVWANVEILWKKVWIMYTCHPQTGVENARKVDNTLLRPQTGAENVILHPQTDVENTPFHPQTGVENVHLSSTCHPQIISLKGASCSC